MTLPKFKVEISFVSAPFSAVPVFVDVSTDVRLNPGITITHGRDDRYSQVQAGTASFTLDNRTGDYTPDNTGGSHYPNMVIGRAVRITATEDNVTFYPRFYGFIDTITVGWDTENASMAVSQITCVDMFKMLSRQHLADNIIAQAMTEPGAPNEWWTFGDPEGTTVPFNAGSTPSALRFWTEAFLSTGTIVFGSATGPGTDDLTAVEVNKLGFRCSSPSQTYNAATPSGNGITIAGFIRADSYSVANSAATIMTMFDDQSNFIIVDVPSGGGGTARFGVDNTPVGGGVSILISGTTNVLDGSTHHIAGTVISTGGVVTAKLYVDGVQEATTVLPGFVFSPPLPVWSVAAEGAVGADTTTYTFAHVALWNDLLTAAEIKSISDAGRNGYSPEASSARATRIAQFGFNVTPTIIGTSGTQHMAPLTDIAGKSVLDLLQTVSDTENGLLYVDRAGALTLKSRLSMYDQSAALSLPADTYDPGLSFLQDDSLLLNDVTTTASGSNLPQRYTDATSQSNYGDIAQQFTIESLDDTEALAYSQWRVGTGKPTTRAPQIGIDLMTQQTTQPTLLANFWQLDLGELVAVSGLPTAAPGSTVSLQCQGITESLTEDSYDATINTTAAPFLAWKLQDATYGVLQSTTVLGY